MKEQLKERITHKLNATEVGSVQNDMYLSILKELDESTRKVSLHVAEEQTCDGCA